MVKLSREKRRNTKIVKMREKLLQTEILHQILRNVLASQKAFSGVPVFKFTSD
jgi:hypothetical protein